MFKQLLFILSAFLKLFERKQRADEQDKHENEVKDIKSLAGCSLIQSVAQTTCQMPPLPTKPTLDVIQNADGGMTLNRDDTEELGIYILELERGFSC